MKSFYRVVLVAPMYGGNVGASARVCANFGIEDVWVVAPSPGWNGREAQMYATQAAAKILRKINKTDSLKEALTDCSLAIGFTRRVGELRQPDLLFESLASLAPSKKTAFVFGREDGGLTTDELLLCNQVCTIPTDDKMPSLNLSHALAVVLSQTRSVSNQKTAEKSQTSESVPLGDLEALLEHWHQTLLDVGITKAKNPERMVTHIRRLLQRAQPSAKEVAILRAFLSKTQVKVGTR